MLFSTKTVYRKFIKRIFDIALSGLALIILSPLFLIISLLVKAWLGSPTIFTQERPGFKGKIFKIYKFRTMLDPQTRDGKKLTDVERLACIENGIDILTDEERLTKFGRFLRAISLDELPELWNIFIGNMSIVGPRPLATIYLPYYTREEMQRHDVRPGLTGMAQIHGRNSVSWEEKFEYDVYYVTHCSFFLDLKIILKTIIIVLKREGIGQGTEKPIAFNLVRQKQWDEEKVYKGELK